MTQNPDETAKKRRRQRSRALLCSGGTRRQFRRVGRKPLHRLSNECLMNLYADDLHPMRFLRRVPGADRIVQQAVRANPQGLLSSDSMDVMTGRVAELYNAKLNELPPDARPRDMDVVVKTVSTLAHIANFAGAGRNSFVFPREMVELLGRTDLGDVRLSDLQLPFRAFYLGFEDGLAVGLPGEPNVIDGAYVECFTIDEYAGAQRYLTFYVTSRRTGREARLETAWITAPEPHFFAPLKLGVAAEDLLGDAIDHATESNDIALQPDAAGQASLVDGIYEGRAEGLPIAEPTSTGFERTAEFNAAALPTMRGVLALICNAICLLSAEPIASEPSWPNDAPEALVDTAVSGSTLKRRRTAVGQLAEKGFFSVRKVALDLAEVDTGAPRNNATTPSGREVAPHWRRGHWRRQAHGAGKLEHRLLWIKPVLVRRDRGNAVDGHVYVVSDT